MNAPQADDPVTVLVQWRETCRYEKRAQMSRAEFKALSARLDRGGRDAVNAQAELFTKLSLNSVEPNDWDDEEIETFEEVIE